MELIDVLDDAGLPTGEVLDKDETHRRQLWHPVAHVWCYNAKGEILLAKRADCKDMYPGMWDLTAAGHINTGEQPQDAAVRELYEEVGIEVPVLALESLGVRKDSRAVPNKSILNNTFSHVYLLSGSYDIAQLRLQKTEVSEARYWSIEDIEKDLHDVKRREMHLPRPEYYQKIFAVVNARIF